MTTRARKKGRAFNQDLMRGEHVVGEKAGEAAEEPTNAGTSIFDPVLCELLYRWFCPPAGSVLDPFAGGSVRGIVASKLGRSYCGIDLSAPQIEANEDQAAKICSEPMPNWIIGDSLVELPKIAGLHDFVFSCPPYFNLEVYSEDARDLSTMGWQEFLTAYRGIIAKACAKLKKDRFACFVVGDCRDKRGIYFNLPGETVAAFQACGMSLYNEAILVTAAGSLPMRARRQFEKSRKLGKTHQNILIFVKGDPLKATEAVGPVEFGSVDGLVPDQAADETQYGELLTDIGSEE